MLKINDINQYIKRDFPTLKVNFIDENSSVLEAYDATIFTKLTIKIKDSQQFTGELKTYTSKTFREAFTTYEHFQIWYRTVLSVVPLYVVNVETEEDRVLKHESNVSQGINTLEDFTYLVASIHKSIITTSENGRFVLVSPKGERRFITLTENGQFHIKKVSSEGKVTERTWTDVMDYTENHVYETDPKKMSAMDMGIVVLSLIPNGLFKDTGYLSVTIQTIKGNQVKISKTPFGWMAIYYTFQGTKYIHFKDAEQLCKQIE